jgi:hypothetical protein
MGLIITPQSSGSSAPRSSVLTTFGSALDWNSSNFDIYAATSQDDNLTINTDSGSPVDGQRIFFRFKDNGTARSLTWTLSGTRCFREVGVARPETTSISKTVYVGCVYNSNSQTWDMVAVSIQT